MIRCERCGESYDEKGGPCPVCLVTRGEAAPEEVAAGAREASVHAPAGAAPPPAGGGADDDVLSTFHEQAPFAGEEDQGSAVREGSGPRAAAPAEESAPDQSFVPEAPVSGPPSPAGPGDEPAAPAL